jgi:hypothetical protein
MEVVAPQSIVGFAHFCRSGTGRVQLINMPVIRISFLLSALILFASPFAIAAKCLNEANQEKMSYSTTVAALQELGFIKGSAGKRNYSPEALVNVDANDIAIWYDGISTVKDPALQFWLRVAGSGLQVSSQADCFLSILKAQDKKILLTDLSIISKLLRKQPERGSLITAIGNIVLAVDGEDVHNFLQDERAVYYTAGGQGVGVNLANARINRKRMQHIPNSVMVLMAQKLEDDGVAHRTTVYQVKHMGYE